MSCTFTCGAGASLDDVVIMNVAGTIGTFHMCRFLFQNGGCTTVTVCSDHRVTNNCNSRIRDAGTTAEGNPASTVYTSIAIFD